MMLTDTDAIGRIAGKLKNQDKGLWEKIKDFFIGLVEKLRSAYQDAEPDSEIAKILKRAIKDNEALAEAWASAVVEAGENYQLQDGQKKNAREGERFSTRENKQTVSEMETIVSVPGYDGSLKASDVIQAVSEFFNSIGNTAENEELGSVVLRKRSIKDDISHGIGREKVAAFMAVPDVLKHGKVVDYQENWKGRGYDTAVVAAPIKISGEDFIAGVCVKRTSGENRFYVHEVLPIKEGATPFNRAALETNVDSGGDTPSMNNILSELLYVKGNLRFSSRNNRDSEYAVTYDDSGNVIPLSQRFDTANEDIRYSSRNTRDSDGNQLTEDQARYFENSRVRDEEGNLKVVYHGSPAIFTEFSADFIGTHGSSEGQGFYFTDYKPMAEGYRKDGGQLLQGYLNIQKPLSDSEVTLKCTEVRKLLHALDPTGDDLVLNYSG